ncbi:PIN domain-containing protein [Rhizobium mongolense]|uniref:PIN domain-containing protein n=1 Tax=Rhizobium mongolense TaxID=57676 RepID=UPI0034A3C8F6
MLHLLIDTCIWLDLSKDYRSQPLISALKDLIAAGEVELIIPQIVVDEFLRKNRGSPPKRSVACNLISDWSAKPSISSVLTKLKPLPCRD